MGRKKKNTPKYSFLTVIVALLVIIGSRFSGHDSNEQKNYEDNSSKTKYETSADKNEIQHKDNNSEKTGKNDVSQPKKQKKPTSSTKKQNDIATSGKKQNDKALNKDNKSSIQKSNDTVAKNESNFDYDKDVTPFSGSPSVEVNNNTPYFPKPKSTKVYKNYSNLDSMNRVGPCEVLTGPEYLPMEKRGDISHVKPTGWKQKKYDFVDGKHLYNRCHLIGFQIAGDNDDWRNLMTGTRYMNVDGMLPYENDITQYIKSTRHHVKYRVTPIFIGNDKVARGVLMQAYSVEDNRIKFNVFCYNVQPRVAIDYSTGYSKLAN